MILGFPISIYGIIMHLSNYYQPNIQCYVVRILWMVRQFTIKLIIYDVPFFGLNIITFVSLTSIIIPSGTFI